MIGVPIKDCLGIIFQQSPFSMKGCGIKGGSRTLFIGPVFNPCQFRGMVPLPVGIKGRLARIYGLGV